jgi:hypothetical protein
MSGFSRSHAHLSLALFASLLLSLGCDDSESPSDPLDGADVVHCEMAEDNACIEYQRVQSGGVDAFVALDEARAVCAAGWSGDSSKPGRFAEGACASEEALARCSISRGYLELDYYYPGFADSETLEDPIPPLVMLCQQSQGTLKTPPF